MKTFFKTLAVALLFASCGEADTAVYKGSSSDQTFLSFSSEFYSLPVEVNDDGSVDVILNSSTASDADRTYNVSIVTAETTADPATYNLPSTVTIPAGAYQGVLRITGQDAGLEESTVLTIILDGLGEDVAFDSNKAVINVQQVCPVDPTKFVGDYLLTETTPYVDGPTLDHGSVVNISIPAGDNNLRRQFTTRNYINYCTTTTMSFKFALVCGQMIVDAGQASTCSCNGALTFGPAAEASTYDANDDSVFYVSFTNDETADCGGVYQTTYKFTKQ